MTATIRLMQATLPALMVLLSRLPDDLPAPEMVVEDDGAISLDWYGEPANKRCVSVHVSPSQGMGYSWLIDEDLQHGAQHVSANLDHIVAAIRQLR